MNLKKIILVIAMFTCLIFVLLTIFFMWFYFTSSFATDTKVINYDFYYDERYGAKGDEEIYYFFEKFYYKADANNFFKNNESYKKVKNNKKNIKEYISTSLNTLHELDSNLNIEFNYEVISSDDYFFFLSSDITKESNILYYYDNDEHILYWMRF